MSERSNLNDRLAGRRQSAEEDGDAFDDFGCFGYLRGARDRSLMVDFRFLNGNREALPYSLLEQVSFNPSGGMTLKFLGVQVVIRGKHLEKPRGNGIGLLEALHRHRVPWIQECEAMKQPQPADGPWITALEWVTGNE